MKLTALFSCVLLLLFLGNGFAVKQRFDALAFSNFDTKEVTLRFPSDGGFGEDEDENVESIDNEVMNSMIKLQTQMTLSCMMKIQRIKFSQCKRDNVAKIEEMGIKEKIGKHVSGIQKMSESEKDKICCMNEREYQCAETVTGDSCSRQMVLLRQLGNLILKKSIDLDCDNRRASCIEEIDEDQLNEETVTSKEVVVPSIEREVETENREASMLDVIKGLDRKTNNGLNVVNEQLNAIKHNMDEKDDLINRKLDKILQQLQSNYAMIDK